MPELPEVLSEISFLKGKLSQKKIERVWSDWPFDLFAYDSDKKVFLRKTAEYFNKHIAKERIAGISSRGKYIIISLSNKKYLIIHQKMTGHLLLGHWEFRKKWQAEENLLNEKINSYIHFVLIFDDGESLALSDVRKFAKIILAEDLNDIFKNCGIEPFTDNFKFNSFDKICSGGRTPIYSLLMDQKKIAGIGNIYACESLFAAKINPKALANRLSPDQKRILFKKIKYILKKGLKYRGSSVSDYRLPDGSMGDYQNHKLVYRRLNEKCFVCGNKIKKEKIKSRTAYYCPYCQKV